MDVTALGGLLLGVGAVFGGLMTYLGKRSENAITGYSSLTNDLQEERDGLKVERTELNTKIAELSGLRTADQAEITRLRAERTELNTRLAEQAALRAADQAEIARLRGLIPPGGPL